MCFLHLYPLFLYFAVGQDRGTRQQDRGARQGDGSLSLYRDIKKHRRLKNVAFQKTLLFSEKNDYIYEGFINSRFVAFIKILDKGAVVLIISKQK